MKYWRPLGLTLVLALLGLILVVSVPSARGGPEAFTIGATEFGMAFINSAEELRSDDRIQRGIAAGAKLDRFPLYWDRIETSPGSFNWSSQDAALRANENQGLGTLAILLGVPGHYWSSAVQAENEAEELPIGGGPARDTPPAAAHQGEGISQNGCDVPGTPPPRELSAPIFSDGSDMPGPGKSVNQNNHWAHFVSLAVQRYRPGGTDGFNVRYWEIWNEQDLCHFWGGTVEEYVRLLKVAYLVIEQYDPNATVLWGGLAIYGPKYEEGRHFLNEMAAAIRADSMASQFGGFFDAAAVHQYSDVTHGYHNTHRVRTALEGTGWESKPVWVTESGVSICDSHPGPPCDGPDGNPEPYRANIEEQASYIWQNIAYSRIAGNNGPIFHFQLHDDGGNECRPAPPADGFGLVTNEEDAQCVPWNGEPRLSYTAYQVAAEYLTNIELLWADIQNGVARRVAFYDPATNERRTLVWAIGGADVTVSLPAAGVTARRLSLDGNETTLTPADGSYQIPVPRATNQNRPGSQAYTIGGIPYMLIERDTLPPQGSIEELLPLSPPAFEVTWVVSDLGSGIEWVTLWYQRDSEPWQVWGGNQPESGTAMFTGESGRYYRFFVQGADRAGNVDESFVPMAETLVSDQPLIVQSSGQVLDMRGEPAPWAQVTIGDGRTHANATGAFSLPTTMGRWDVAVQGKT
ncbi:MAG: hypothetical protein ACRDIB_15830, partial [Ardenticatenaceae bacterium]